MSVLASQRDISFHEFRKRYNEFRSEVNILYEKLPKRKMEYVNQTDLFPLLNQCHINIVKVDKMMFMKSKNESDYFKLIDDTVDLVCEIPDNLYHLLLLSRNISIERIKRMEKQLNDVIFLLNRIKKMEFGVGLDVTLFDRRKIRGVKVLERSVELINTTYTHVTHLPNKYKMTLRHPMFDVSIEIFKCIYNANEIYPDSYDGINKRFELFQEALAYANYYDNLLLEFFILNSNFPNDIAKYWSNVLLEIQKMINGIIESDKTRRKHL